MLVLGKVSMIVPCYNKDKYIGAMLESVVAQKWDNIEVILVNDGSTDSTKEIIMQYEPRLTVRGYDVVVVDQENAGCCSAVYAGLIRMQGDYMCLADADDELDPEYVSTMTGWLDENDDFDWAVCSYRPYMVNEGAEKPLPVTSCAAMSDNKHLLERHILRRIITTSWVYMVRSDYLKRCRLIENFCTERRKTYEPLFAVPLMLGEGKLKCFDRPLYKFNRFASDMYCFDSFEKIDKYYSDYSYLYEWGIQRANINQHEKERLSALVGLGRAMDYLYHLNDMDPIDIKVIDSVEYIDEFASKTTSLIDVLFEPKPNLAAGLFKTKGYRNVFDPLVRIVLEQMNGKFINLSEDTRVIGYGVLGKVANALLPILNGTRLEPHLYWDLAAGLGVEINGKAVTEPLIDLVRESDVIIVFPKAREVFDYVQQICNGATVVRANELTEISIWKKFREIPFGCRFRYNMQ